MNNKEKYNPYKKEDDEYKRPPNPYDQQTEDGEFNDYQNAQENNNPQEHQNNDYNDRKSRTNDNNNNNKRQPNEEPSRVLFVRNINYNTNEEKIKDIFSQYGEIRKFFALVPLRGMCFVTYYDIRHSIKAKDELHNYQLDGRRIDPHYSLPREDDEGTANCDTMKVVFSLESPNENELREYFSRYGELDSIKQGSNQNERMVKYFDVRATETALKECNGKPFANDSSYKNVMDCTMIIPPKKLNNQNSNNSNNNNNNNNNSSAIRNRNRDNNKNNRDQRSNYRDNRDRDSRDNRDYRDNRDNYKQRDQSRGYGNNNNSNNNNRNRNYRDEHSNNYNSHSHYNEDHHRNHPTNQDQMINPNTQPINPIGNMVPNILPNLGLGLNNPNLNPNIAFLLNSLNSLYQNPLQPNPMQPNPLVNPLQPNPMQPNPLQNPLQNPMQPNPMQNPMQPNPMQNPMQPNPMQQNPLQPNPMQGFDSQAFASLIQHLQNPLNNHTQDPRKDY